MTADRLRALLAEVRADSAFVQLRLDEACTFPAAGANVAELAYGALLAQLQSSIRNHRGALEVDLGVLDAWLTALVAGS